MKLRKTTCATLLFGFLAACGGADPDNMMASDGPCSPSPDDCLGETICVSSACVPAYDRLYRLTVVDAVIPATTETGTLWDDGGSTQDPDVFVNIWVDGVALARTTTAQDTLSPMWNEGLDVRVLGGSKLVFEFIDEDLFVDDPITNCTFDPIDVEGLRLRRLLCESAGMAGFVFHATIEPKG
jgi:hypothetical protein